MLLLALFALGCLLSPLVLAEYPEGLRVRKSINDLTTTELLAFKSALYKLYSVTIDGKESIMDRFTKVYIENTKIASNSPYQLPWRRYFLQMFENELRKFDPKVTVPYWVMPRLRASSPPPLPPSLLIAIIFVYRTGPMRTAS